MSEKTFYMVYLEGERAPAFKHTTPESADAEAKRLTDIHGKTAYVLCAIKSYRVNKYIVEDLRPDDDLPF